MTPEQKIKRAILLKAAASEVITLDGPITADNVDELYDANNEEYELQDYESEMRGGEVETGLRCEWSRHYESKAVAANIDGEWIGWAYWYGGGKHGEPESIDWMSGAYLLKCTEEQKLVTVRTFTKQEEPAPSARVPG